MVLDFLVFAYRRVPVMPQEDARLLEEVSALTAATPAATASPVELQAKSRGNPLSRTRVGAKQHPPPPPAVTAGHRENDDLYDDDDALVDEAMALAGAQPPEIVGAIGNEEADTQNVQWAMQVNDEQREAEDEEDEEEENEVELQTQAAGMNTFSRAGMLPPAAGSGSRALQALRTRGGAPAEAQPAAAAAALPAFPGGGANGAAATSTGFNPALPTWAKPPSQRAIADDAGFEEVMVRSPARPLIQNWTQSPLAPMHLYSTPLVPTAV
jgi:hypothetical protein